MMSDLIEKHYGTSAKDKIREFYNHFQMMQSVYHEISSSQHFFSEIISM
jgi:hypothetical protein